MLIAGDNALDLHSVLRQRAGFVGHDRAATAQRFNGGQVPNDGVALGHAANADGQRDRHHDRQTFGDRRDGERDGKQEHVGGAAAHRDPDSERDRGDHQDDASDPFGQAIHALLQRRRHVFGTANLFSNLTEFSIFARSDHDPSAAARCYRSTQEGHIGLIGRR